jgi:hypothetical protein
MLNFGAMALWFSINHGTVTALIAVTSSKLSENLYAWQTAVLYINYTLTALTFASFLVQKLGPKWGVFSGVALYCFYVASFLAADEVPEYAWEFSITGSVIGGFGAGYLWSAQGVFFARSAEARPFFVADFFLALCAVHVA